MIKESWDHIPVLTTFHSIYNYIDGQRATSKLHASMTGRNTVAPHVRFLLRYANFGDRCVPRFSNTERNGTFRLVPHCSVF